MIKNTDVMVSSGGNKKVKIQLQKWTQKKDELKDLEENKVFKILIFLSHIS